MPTSRKKKFALGCAAFALLLFVVLAIGARRFLFPRHWDVVSIATVTDYQDAPKLKRAFALPVAARYEDAEIVYQTNGSLCGPTSIANVLRSLDASGASATSATVLSGAGKCRLGICLGGLTLDELSELARFGTGRRVTVIRDLSLVEFREHLVRANDPARRYVVNFDRGPLFGTGGGHHSPIGGYLAEEDLVLVLDVNAKYKPWLASSARLYEAMQTQDPASGLLRGLLLIE